MTERECLSPSFCAILPSLPSAPSPQLLSSRFLLSTPTPTLRSLRWLVAITAGHLLISSSLSPRDFGKSPSSQSCFLLPLSPVMYIFFFPAFVSTSQLPSAPKLFLLISIAIITNPHPLRPLTPFRIMSTQFDSYSPLVEC